MDGVAVKPLTVGFHEGQFLDKLNQENRAGFWFQLDDTERQHFGSPMGPVNAQALNRYSYVQNNPLKWVDPTGHQQAKTQKMSKSDLDDLAAEFDREISRLQALITVAAITTGAVVSWLFSPWVGVPLGLAVEAMILAVNEQSASVKNFLADIEDVMSDTDTVEIIDTGQSVFDTLILDHLLPK